MSLFRFFKNSRKSQNIGRRAPRTQKARVRPCLEFLEDRNLMSIHWVNEAASFNDSDGFGAVFGSQAVTARLVVEAAIQGWAGAIENFNYADGTNDFKLTVNMGSDKNTGASAAFASKVDANHKPMAGTITLGAGTDGHGAGYFLDPTPFESSEFQGTVINAYAANATAGGPADRLTDLFTIMTLELTHEMGILDDPNIQWFRDPNHYLQDAHKADAAEPGELWTYTGPDVIALLTTDNAGSNAGDSNPLHTAEPNAGNVVTANNHTYYGSHDSGNAFFEFGRRYLVSHLDVLILQDSYGYTLTPPTFDNNMYMIFDQNAGSLLIRGGSAGENTYPGQSDPSNDAIQLTTVANPQFLSTPNYVVFVTIGNPVPGTGLLRVYTNQFFEGALNTITIDAGDGSNAIGIDGVQLNTSVLVKSHGPDIVTITFGYAQNIGGPVAVTNATATTTLVLDASPDRVGRDVTITGSSVVGLDRGTISFNPAQLSSLTVNGGSGGNLFTVPGTLAGTRVTLNAGRGSDIVVVGNAADGLGDLNISSALTVNGAAGFTTLLLDDRANTSGTGYQVHNDKAIRTLGLHQVFYTGLSSLILDAGSGGNEITVLDTPAAMATRINAGPGGDFVHAGGSLIGNVSTVLGPLTVQGQGGNTTFTVFDQSTTTDQTYTLTDTSLTRSGGFAATFADIQSLSVDGGSGVNTLAGPNATTIWMVQGAGSGTLGANVSFNAMTNLAGGSGDDTFTFAAAGSIAGTLAGGAGTDSVNFAAQSGPVTVNLQTGAAPRIDGGAVGGFSTIESWTATASAADTLIGFNANTNWLINSPGGGTVGGVVFTGFENLVGGFGVDVFRFAGSGRLSGSLNGGAAPLRQGNWLDYTGLTIPVNVNLLTGAATGVAGKVSNIQNAHGGNGGSTLTGNALGNILIGGTGADSITGGAGPSLLIGDAGADSVTGGGGGDILIGDTTTLDRLAGSNLFVPNLQALMGILAEWQSADTYDIRFHDINTGTGGGLNGTAKLNFGTTVLDDGAADTVSASPTPRAPDWFFEGAGDTLQNVVRAEHINNNTPAAFKDRTVTSPINEGGRAVVSGTITDPDPRDPFTLVVNWGDGKAAQTYTFPPGSDGKRVSVSHRYADNGTYTIQLSWHDPMGPANNGTLTVTVNNVAPTVDAGGDATLKKGQTFRREGSFTDPGADTWAATVDYGDGAGPQPLKLKGRHFTLQHNYSKAGTYHVVVTVRDADGGVGTASFDIAVRQAALR